MIKPVASKWEKTRVLNEVKYLQEHIPETRFMTRGNLRRMLDQYNMVYIKPDVGTSGRGVMRVDGEERKEQSEETEETTETDKVEQTYRYQHELNVHRFTDLKSMHASISNETKGKVYLVQRGIHMLTYHHKPFDLRVMVQQSQSKKWVVTGMIGRVAEMNKIVTNIHNGGKAKEAGKLLDKYMNSSQKGRIFAELKSLGLEVAAQMKRNYKEINEVGLDIAIDSDYKPWILEVNTVPDPYIFRFLNDKDVLAKVIRNARRNRGTRQ